MRHLARPYSMCVVCLLLSMACSPKTDHQARENAATAEIDAKLKQQPPPPKNALEGLMAAADHQGSLAEAMVSRSMTAPMTAPPAPAEKGRSGNVPPTPERTAGNDAGLMALLPSVNEQVPHVWIGWYKNQAIDAFRAAIDVNRPLVLVLSDNTCAFCENLIKDTLRCPAVERWAGDAVFAYSNVAVDPGARALDGALKMDAHPAVTVLEPESRILLERGRITGSFDGGVTGQHLATILRDTPPRSLPDSIVDGAPSPKPAPITSPEPTASAAASGASRLKLAHTLPAPVCR